MRASGAPSVVAVAKLMASASGTPEASASPYQASNCFRGLGSTSDSFRVLTNGSYCRTESRGVANSKSLSHSATAFGLIFLSLPHPGDLVCFGQRQVVIDIGKIGRASC